MQRDALDWALVSSIPYSNLRDISPFTRRGPWGLGPRLRWDEVSSPPPCRCPGHPTLHVTQPRTHLGNRRLTVIGWSARSPHVKVGLVCTHLESPGVFNWVTRKGPELDQIWAWVRWLDRDNPETNPISKTPETVSHKEGQFFLTCCSLLEHHFPIKSFTSLVCVSSQKISFPSVSSSSSSVRQEPTFRPLKGSFFGKKLRSLFHKENLREGQGSAKPLTSCWLRCRRRHASPRPQESFFLCSLNFVLSLCF